MREAELEAAALAQLSNDTKFIHEERRAIKRKQTKLDVRRNNTSCCSKPPSITRAGCPGISWRCGRRPRMNWCTMASGEPAPGVCQHGALAAACSGAYCFLQMIGKCECAYDFEQMGGAGVCGAGGDIVGREPGPGAEHRRARGHQGPEQARDVQRVAGRIALRRWRYDAPAAHAELYARHHRFLADQGMARPRAAGRRRLAGELSDHREHVRTAECETRRHRACLAHELHGSDRRWRDQRRGVRADRAHRQWTAVADPEPVPGEDVRRQSRGRSGLHVRLAAEAGGRQGLVDRRRGLRPHAGFCRRRRGAGPSHGPRGDARDRDRRQTHLHGGGGRAVRAQRHDAGHGSQAAADADVFGLSCSRKSKDAQP
jgi:hypothetical protein